MDYNVQKYIAFIKTVETGSFSKAADEMNYSQSGVSRMVQDLEQEWKVTLLERRKGGLHLTSEGTRLLPYAQAVLLEMEKLQTEVDQLNGLDSGLIRIGTFSSIATHWLPAMIKGFKDLYPNIDYEILLGTDYLEIETWIEEGRVDLGFTHLPSREGFETIFLNTDELLCVMPPDHPLKDLDKYPSNSLETEPFLMLENGMEEEVSGIFAKNGHKLHVRFTTWDDYAIMAMVESGLGISILPKLMLERTPYNLVTKEFDIPTYRNIGIALRNRESAPIAVRKFITYLLDTIS